MCLCLCVLLLSFHQSRSLDESVVSTMASVFKKARSWDDMIALYELVCQQPHANEASHVELFLAYCRLDSETGTFKKMQQIAQKLFKLSSGSGSPLSVKYLLWTATCILLQRGGAPGTQMTLELAERMTLKGLSDSSSSSQPGAEAVFMLVEIMLEKQQQQRRGGAAAVAGKEKEAVAEAEVEGEDVARIFAVIDDYVGRLVPAKIDDCNDYLGTDGLAVSQSSV